MDYVDLDVEFISALVKVHAYLTTTHYTEAGMVKGYVNVQVWRGMVIKFDNIVIIPVI